MRVLEFDCGSGKTIVVNVELITNIEFYDEGAGRAETMHLYFAAYRDTVSFEGPGTKRKYEDIIRLMRSK